MKFYAPALLGGLAAVASAAELDKRYWEQVSAWCDDKTVTVTETVTVGSGGGSYSAPPPPPPITTPYTSEGHVTSVHYSTSGAATYTTIEVWPTGGGSKKDCTRVVYKEKEIIKVEVIVIIEVIIHGTTTYSTQPGTVMTTATSIPPPVTPPSTYTSAPPSTGSSTPKTYDVELRADLDSATGKTIFHYVPDSVNANLGDVVNFIFKPKAHSVTQSEFKTPCTFNGGFDTGLLNGTADGSVTRKFTVNDVSKPLWFYCKQKVPVSHCGAGMVFGINPGNKMDQFIKNAIAQDGGNATATTSASGTISTGTATATSSSAAATHSVIVEGGLNLTAHTNTLKYDPPFIQNVKKDDVIIFDFRKLNHTASESTFDAPCKKRTADAFDTNFQDVNPMDVPGLHLEKFIMPDDQAHYFYCRQANGLPTGHCSNGMVFAVNVDAARFGAFQDNARKTLPPTARLV